ncbi:MAG TPA: tripartite tricarboxylate transporter substrate binding protein [Burkholderiaceae bacterium]|nr:tripartite tricarboxylate transporter substrate binding protein [Burkholderiaceae bacterium]
MAKFRSFAGVIAGVLSCMMISPALASAAETYPNKPVTIVVPFPAGGATDVIARLVAEKVAPAWGQPIVIRNQPGAGTTLAAEQISRTQPDGYTLYMTTASHTIGANLYKNLRYDAMKDFTPISLSATIPLVLVTANNVPVTDLPSLLEFARKSPEGLTMASSGNGTPGHLTGETFKSLEKLELVHIPYRGDTPMLTDLLGGQVQMAFVTLSAALPHIQDGRLRAIALAHGSRIDAIKDVPTMEELGYKNFRYATWFGLLGPAGIDESIQQTIYKYVHEAVSSEDLTKRFLDMGAQVNNSTPEEFRAFIQEEIKSWGDAVRLSGASVD